MPEAAGAAFGSSAAGADAHDGGALASLDALIPAPADYRGKAHEL